jgi:transposase
MAKRISREDRELIIDGYSNQKNVEELADIFKCSVSTIYRIVSAYHLEGRTEARQWGGFKPQVLSNEHKEAICAYIADDCAITLEAIKQRLFDDFGVGVSVPTIHRAIDRF